MEGQSGEVTIRNGEEPPSSIDTTCDRDLTESSDPEAGRRDRDTPGLSSTEDIEPAPNGDLDLSHGDLLSPVEVAGNFPTNADDDVGLNWIINNFTGGPSSSQPAAIGDVQHNDLLEPLRLVEPVGLGGQDSAMEFLDFDADFADLLKAIGDENGQEAPEPGQPHSQEDGAIDLEIGHGSHDESGANADDLLVSDAEFDDAIAGLQVDDIDPDDIDFTGDSLAGEMLSDEAIRDDDLIEDVAFLATNEHNNAFEPLALDVDISEALGTISLGPNDTTIRNSLIDDKEERPDPTCTSSRPVETDRHPEVSTDNPIIPQHDVTDVESGAEDATLPQSRLTPEEESLALFNRLSLDDFLSESEVVRKGGLGPLICGECTLIGHRVFPEEENPDDTEPQLTPSVVSDGAGRGKPASFVLNGQLRHASVKSGVAVGNLNQIAEEVEESEKEEEKGCTQRDSGDKCKTKPDESKSDDKSKCHVEANNEEEEVDPFEAAIAADIAKQRIDLDELLKLSLLSLKDEQDAVTIPTEATNPAAPLQGASKKKLRVKNKLSRKDTNSDRKEKKSDHDVRCGRQRSFRQKQSKSDSMSKKLALDAAVPYISSFGSIFASDHQQSDLAPTLSDAASKPPFKTPKNERSCLGHRDTVFGLSFSPDGRFLASASQDSTVCIWNVRENSLAATITGHSKKYGCLRVAWAPGLHWGGDKTKLYGAAKDANETELPLLASAGTDGLVKVWRLSYNDDDAKIHWECIGEIDHVNMKEQAGIVVERSNSVDSSGDGLKANSREVDEEQEEEPPHIYVLQFVEGWQYSLSVQTDHPGDDDTSAEPWKGMLLSSDEFVHLWEPAPEEGRDAADNDLIQKIEFKCCLAFRFGKLNEENGGVLIHSVAGLPGPHHSFLHDTRGVFVFDASYCQANSLLGVALSDGSLRLINIRGICVSILQLPGCSSNITSFAWDSTGTRLASSVATGHVVLWDLDVEDGKESSRGVGCSCRAVLEGGHERGRPLFGVKYCGGQPQRLLLSWGSDGKLCLWDSSAFGQVTVPLSVLLSRQNTSFFAVDTATTENEHTTGTALWENIVAVGGCSDVSFLGVPVQLFDLS